MEWHCKKRQSHMSWWKLEAYSNICSMLVTLETSHEFNGGLKLDTERKMKPMLVTLEVSHESNGRLKLEAKVNINDMS